MFWITDDPSSGSLVQCFAQNYKNGSNRVRLHGQGRCYGSSAFLYSELHTRTRVRICCHNTDLVHVNGHDIIILVIFSQALYKAP